MEKKRRNKMGLRNSDRLLIIIIIINFNNEDKEINGK